MAKDFCFTFYPGDYLRDTQCLTENSQVAYDRMMCEHMRNISVSQKLFDFFTKKLSESEKADLLAVLDKVEGGYQIHWVALSVSKRKAYSESRSKNKKGKTKIISNHKEDEIEIEKETKNDFGKSENLLGRNLPTTEVKVVPLVVEPDFETFWNLYDKKVDRKAAEKLWSKLSKTDKEKIIEHVPKYTRSKPDKQFRKDPDGYLRSESWNDEIITPNGNTNTLRSTAQVGTATSAGKF